MTDIARREEFKRDFATGATYTRVSDAAVAYTLEIREAGEHLLADYDASGGVRGIEFLGGRAGTMEHCRSIAARNSKGAAAGRGREKPV